MLEIALGSGEFLESCWEHVFKILSEVSRLRQVYERLRSDESFLATRAAGSAGDSSDNNNSSSNNDDDEKQLSEHAIDDANAEKLSETISEELIDKIYQSSSKLSEKAVRDFIEQLCRVSRMEIGGYHDNNESNDTTTTNNDNHFSRRRFVGGGVVGIGGMHQPVIYSLQKLVEVAHYQMESRGRIGWEKIWYVVSAHFVNTALDSNEAVCMFAVDSLRQLSIKFLQRAELGQFGFQRKFLRPYEEIMARSTHATTRDLVLQCIGQIILACGPTLRSGWHAVFSVLGIAGGDNEGGISSTAYAMLDKQCKAVLAEESLRETHR